MTQHNPDDFIFSQSYIDGSWVSSCQGQTFSVYDPYDGTRISSVPRMNAQDTCDAIEAAEQAFPAWRDRLPAERARLLLKWKELILTHRDKLARLMVQEQGKPYPEARGEIGYGASFIQWFAEEATRAQGALIPTFAVGRRLIVLKQPIGVVAAITPWNFPNAMITRKCAPALAAGCTVVIKPAEDTPLSALALAHLAHEAGIPPGVFNVITTDREGAKKVGEVLCTDSRVRKVGFTGSTAVGKHVMSLASSTVKRVSLELGGNAPFIFFEDADLELALRGIMVSKFRNAGQTCICANRIFVHRSRLDEFTQALLPKVRNLKLGSGAERGTTTGPLINDRAIKRAHGLVTRALEEGAELLCGGHILNQALEPSDHGIFYAPTILTQVTSKMEIAQAELFAPIVTLIPFDDETEVLRMANDTPYGLAAYFFTEDHRRIWRVSESLEYGMVAVNDGSLSTAVAPFGGIKESGIGREGSSWGLDEFLEMKYVMMGGLDR